MQWASSTTNNPILSAISWSNIFLNSSFPSLSGETIRASTSPFVTSCIVSSQLSLLLELIDFTLRFNLVAELIWFSINTSNGLIIRANFSDFLRIIFVAIKYTRLFPHPVFWTTSVLLPSRTAIIASSCPSRYSASAP